MTFIPAFCITLPMMLFPETRWTGVVLTVALTVILASGAP